MTMPKFSPTITVGNVLTVILIFVGGFWYFADLERELTQLRGDFQTQIVRIDGRIDMANGLHKTELDAIRRDLAKILQSIDRLANQRSK